jgi:hypothetical protein
MNSNNENVYICNTCKEPIIKQDTLCKVISSNKFGIKLADGNWYCVACADIMDIMSLTPPKIVNTKVTIQQTKSTSPTRTISYFYCSTCNKHATGSKCMGCNKINPLTLSRKKLR